MSDGMCVICWSHEAIEHHHVAGQSNHDRTVPLCKMCHKLVTLDQHRQGIDLTGNWRPYQEKARAIILGHLMIWRHMMTQWELNFSRDLREVDSTIKPPRPMYGIQPESTEAADLRGVTDCDNRGRRHTPFELAVRQAGGHAP